MAATASLVLEQIEHNRWRSPAIQSAVFVPVLIVQPRATPTEFSRSPHRSPRGNTDLQVNEEGPTAHVDLHQLGDGVPLSACAVEGTPFDSAFKSAAVASFRTSTDGFRRSDADHRAR